MAKEKIVAIEIVSDEDTKGYGFDLKSVVDDHAPALPSIDDDIPKSRGKTTANGFVPAAKKSAEKTPLNSEMPFSDTYTPTLKMLTDTVANIDSMYRQIDQDIAKVRKLRDSAKKFEYMSMLNSNNVSLINNRLSAIKEMNSIISKCHDLELKKAKELHSMEQVDDDKRLMDMYQAYVNMPMGMAGAMPYANVPQSAIMSAGTGAVVSDPNSFNDPGYNQWEQNMSPEMKAMLMEGDPSIATVLVYDTNTQEKHFENINRYTGETIPGLPVPPDFILEGTVPDIVRGTARNAATNQNFELKIIGQRAVNEY